MNERIKQIARQAEEYAFDELTKIQGPVEMSISRRIFKQSFREMFAELIVQECIDLLPDACQSNNGCHASWVIKEHFGDEE